MSYRYQLSTDVPAAYACAHWEALTFPSLRQKAATRHWHGPLTAVVALHQGRAIGLVLAERQPAEATAQVVSLAVHQAHRGRGVGTRLLSELERHLARTDSELLGGVFQSDWGSRPAIEALLRRRGWSSAEPRMLIGRGRAETVAAAPWWRLYRLAAGFSLFPWGELTDAEQREQRQRACYPPELSPFQAAGHAAASPSLGLRYGQRVVGWMLTHQVVPDTLQYTALFVEPEYHKPGQGLALLGATIARQVAEGQVPYGSFLVHTANTGMLAFARQRLRHLLLASKEVYWTQKALPAHHAAKIPFHIP